MKAIQFGTDTVGRGLIAALLHQAGYHVTFADDDDDRVQAIVARGEYRVHRPGGDIDTVDGISAVNHATEPGLLAQQISTANMLTLTVDDAQRLAVIPHLMTGLGLRDPAATPLQVMVCAAEPDATDILHQRLIYQVGAVWDALAARAVFANTVVNGFRGDDSGADGLDVSVHDPGEWAIERIRFRVDTPVIPGARLRDDISPR